MDYDPAVISYEKLLGVFWDSHYAGTPSWSRQYMSIIFFHNDDQKRLAIESRDHEAVRIKGKIFTEIVPATEFYLAEAYHQKYRLRSEPDLVMELRAIYPREEDFVNSTAAARVNGYLDGYGTLSDLQEELPGFGLSPAASKRLTEIVTRRKGKAACKL
jgi:peptide-methionine (S)-S-oxide reductase